jgi:hypothetical protein
MSTQTQSRAPETVHLHFKSMKWLPGGACSDAPVCDNSHEFTPVSVRVSTLMYIVPCLQVSTSRQDRPCPLADRARPLEVQPREVPCVHTCICVHIYRTCLVTHLYTYICICIYIHTYIHTNIQTFCDYPAAKLTTCPGHSNLDSEVLRTYHKYLDASRKCVSTGLPWEPNLIHLPF